MVTPQMRMALEVRMAAALGWTDVNEAHGWIVGLTPDGYLASTPNWTTDWPATGGLIAKLECNLVWDAEHGAVTASIVINSGISPDIFVREKIADHPDKDHAALYAACQAMAMLMETWKAAEVARSRMHPLNILGTAAA